MDNLDNLQTFLFLYLRGSYSCTYFRSQVMVETIKRTLLKNDPDRDVIEGIMNAALVPNLIYKIKVSLK